MVGASPAEGRSMLTDEKLLRSSAPLFVSDSGALRAKLFLSPEGGG